MKTFKRKTFYTAVLAAMGAMSVAGSANAVHLSPAGTGQVLIYPYYTTRTAGPGDFATYLNVANTTRDFKAVKVRFLEGKNGRGVQDFNLYLSPYDVWAGAISKVASGGAALTSVDRSCVTKDGSFAASVAAGTIYSEFVNYAFVGISTTSGTTDGNDGEDQSLDRVREGYFEIIEMGTITNSTITRGLKHNSAGVPANCGVVALIDEQAAGSIGNNFVESPTGGLIGGASLINVLAGSDYGYDPVALEEFFFSPTSLSANIWTNIGNVRPDMGDAVNTSRVFYYHQTADGVIGQITPNGRTTEALITDWTIAPWNRGVDAVSAVLMRDSVMNAYVLDSATLSLTDWIVTFPTKHHYISANGPTGAVNDPNGTQKIAPFHNFFWTGGSCDPVWITSWDREEQTFQTQLQPGVPKPAPPGPKLCWEVNVITFKNTSPSIADASTLLGSKNRLEVQVLAGFQNGLAKLGLNLSPAPMIGAARTIRGATAGESYIGLPVVGFMVQDFLNTSITIGGLPSTSAYGGNFNHKYTQLIIDGGVTP